MEIRSDGGIVIVLEVECDGCRGVECCVIDATITIQIL